MSTNQPQRRLHRLRGGDGNGLPTERPAELWPDFSDLAPYWESFTAFARTELGRDDDIERVRTEFIQNDDGTWRFRATTSLGKKPQEPTGQTYAQILTYDSGADEMQFKDTRDGSSWVMEAAFGDQTAATSRL